MTQHLKAALLCAIVAVVFLALEIAFQVRTGTAGVFIMGAAGGLLLGNQIAKTTPPKPAG